MGALAAQPLDRLLTGTTVHIRGNPQVSINSIATDSRATQPGALFFCLQGERVDGHDFASAAVAAGAVAVVAKRPLQLPEDVTLALVADPLTALSPVAAAFYGQPSRQLTCIGITGTNGKTTTTFLVEAMARAADLRFGVTGTLGAWLDEARLEELSNTTPFAHELQHLLAHFRDAGAQGAVIEVSSHALELHRVDDIEFDVVAQTNLSHDHLDFHGTFEAYRDAKRKLFLANNPQRTKPIPSAVLNLDDPEGKTLAHLLKRSLTFGINNAQAVFNATDIVLRADGSQFTVSALRPSPFVLRLPGPFNVSNAMAALAIGCALDLDVEAMAEGLESVRQIPGRMVSLPARDATVFVDYAHTPDGMEKVLNAARAVSQNRVLCVFGCGGNRDRSKRPLMGRIAQELADYVILTNDNPRHEDPQSIIADITAGMNGSTGRREIIPDRSRAIGRAIALAQAGDVVVIAGKGHESYQLVGDDRIPFSDVAVAESAIRQVLQCR